MKDFSAKDGNEVFLLTGDYVLPHIEALEKNIETWKRRHAGREKIRVDAAGLGKLDTAGAWLIEKHFSGAVFTGGFPPRQQTLMDFFISMPGQKNPENKNQKSQNVFYVLGREITSAFRSLHELFAFVGAVFACVGKSFFGARRFRLPSIVRHIQETGLNALPIICLLGFGISMVIFYQGATQLKKFGADIYTVDLTVISLLREMAVLTTAIMVAGRSGSSFAAEIGVMKLRGEIDALKTMGVDPIEALVMPRLIALLITLPMLSFIADIVGLAGGSVMSRFMLNISIPQYIDRVQTVATPTMFFIGMVKTPVLALLITVICTYQGMSVAGSAENLGKLTTRAVVQSIFFVIMADAVFSIVFSALGI